MNKREEITEIRAIEEKKVDESARQKLTKPKVAVSIEDNSVYGFAAEAVILN